MKLFKCDMEPFDNTIWVDAEDICEDTFDLYDYEDYIGIAHQIIAEEMGYETI